MELSLYVPQTTLYTFLQNHPKFFSYIGNFQDSQQERFVMVFDELEIKERAIQYFDCEALYFKDHMLCYDNVLRSTTYKIKIESYQIIIYNYEQNPLYPFLQRIYRNYLTYIE